MKPSAHDDLLVAYLNGRAAHAYAATFDHMVKPDRPAIFPGMRPIVEVAEHWDDRTPEQQAAIEERTGWLWDYYGGKHAGNNYRPRPAIFPGMRAIDAELHGRPVVGSMTDAFLTVYVTTGPPPRLPRVTRPWAEHPFRVS